MHDDDLLAPSLENETIVPIYSVGALIAAAFFGGGLAVTMLAADNASRLRRVGKDLVWLLLAGALSIGLVVWALLANAEQDPTAIPREARVYVRALGFGLCGLFFLLHRTAYRTMSVSGRSPPSPYKAVAVSVFISFGTNMLIGVIVAANVPVA